MMKIWLYFSLPIHKSKGLEWNKVFILDRHRFFPKWAKRLMKVQENNIVYVAITRQKRILYIFNLPTGNNTLISTPLYWGCLI